MQRLRDPGAWLPLGIWRQSFDKHLCRITWKRLTEVADAIAKRISRKLSGEWAILRFRFVYYAQLGQRRAFCLVRCWSWHHPQTLVRRHPHVFPDCNLRTAAGQA